MCISIIQLIHSDTKITKLSYFNIKRPIWGINLNFKNGTL